MACDLTDWSTAQAAMLETLNVVAGFFANSARVRNKRISAAYAGLFLESANTPERLYWACTAALVSSQVGRLLSRLNPIRRSLADGNRAVFEEVWPALRFAFTHRGCPTAVQCMSLPPELVANSGIRKACQLILQGKTEKAAKEIAIHEQMRTLQMEVFAQRTFGRWVRWYPLPITLTFEGRSGTDTWRFDGTNHDFLNASKRTAFAISFVVDIIGKLQADVGEYDALLRNLVKDGAATQN